MKKMYCGFGHNTVEIHLKRIINISVCIYKEREMTNLPWKDIHQQTCFTG